MSQNDLDELATQLGKAHVTTDSSGDGGVSFENKQLKLDTEDDAKEVVEAIKKCDNLQYLHLGGNTLGVDAAKAISKALQSHKELKRALWMDMFTGRMKTEIPKALNFLGAGLALSGAQLVELDLSDNAFGPIGMQGLAALLQSPTCYTLQVLKLNNNGLGITGGKLLSRALLNCYAGSKAAGRALRLQVFVAGRNRLENEGATAIAEVFQVMGTLEEVSMPQNGIWHKGISALCEAFAANPGLRVVNLNDNTVREKGAASMARALPGLQKLSCLNLGDCLVKTRGAMLLADALADGHPDLQELNLGFNEISAKGGLALAKAMGNKSKLGVLDIGGNLFGKSGCESVASELVRSGRRDALASLSEDEGDSEEEDESEDDGTNDVDDGEEEDSNNESNNSLDVTSSPKVAPPTTLNIPRIPGMSGEDSPKSTIPQVRKLIEEESPKNADIPQIPKLLHMSSSEFVGSSCWDPNQLLLSPKSATLLCSRSSFRDSAPAVTSPKSCTFLHTSQTSPLALASSRSPATLFRDVSAEPASDGCPSLPIGTNTLEGFKITAVEGPGDGDAPCFSELIQDGTRVTVGEFLKDPTSENFLNLGSNRTKLLLNEVKSCRDDEYLARVMPLLMKVSSLSTSTRPSICKPALECTKTLYQEIFRWGQEMGQSISLLNTLLVHLGLLKTDDKTFERTWNVESCVSALEHAVQQNCIPSSAMETVTLFLKRQTSRATNTQATVLTPVTIA